MNRSSARQILFLTVLAILTAWTISENVAMYQQMNSHTATYRALQKTLKERRQNQAESTALDRLNCDGLSRLASQALPLETMPDFIRDLDQRMAARSLFREDVVYARKESVGSFGLVRVQLQLTGPYEEFRRFLANLEESPTCLWVKSVQALQAKTTQKFILVLHVLMKTN